MIETESTARRKEVANLLREVADHKLVFGNTKVAAQKARKAYELARQNPELDAIWRALAAYRLAHLAFRTATSRKELQLVDQLFSEAASSHFFRPLPDIYRLAVLQRLQAQYPEACHDEKISRTFDDAVGSFRDWHTSAHAEGEAWKRAPVQNGIFNMIEFASYFLGIPYKLEGLGLDQHDSSLGALFPSNPELCWHLVGHEKELKVVRYSRQLALAELDAIGRRCPDAILFKLSREDEHHIRRGSGTWTPEGVNGLKLLATLLLGVAQNKDELHFKVMCIPRGGDTAPFRSMKRRLRKTLREMLSGCPQDEVFVDNEPGGMPALNENIPIYGAIEWRMFRA
jgi:hypothetical protein